METDDETRESEETDESPEDETETEDTQNDESSVDEADTVDYWKRRSRQNEREAKRARRELEKLRNNPPPEKDGGEPDLEQIRSEVRAEVEAELLRSRVEDKIEAKARAFADPEDAVAVLLRSYDIDDFIDDGKIDVEAITEALDDLGKRKPHLLAQGKRFGGGGDGGVRKDSIKPSQLSRDDLKNMTPEEIVKAKADGRLNDLLGVS